MVKTKANQKIHIDLLKTTLDKLGQLKEKPKEELTLRESIYFLRDKLKSALKKGYSYEDLSDILEEQGILISASTLKQYLTDITKESAGRRKRSKETQSQTKKSEEKGSSVLTTQPGKNTRTSKSKSETVSDKDVNIHQEKSDKDLNIVESDTVVKVSKSVPKKESGKSRANTKTGTKTKTKKLSGTSEDLKSDFNQY
ncbi:MAG: hypothetical protein QNJ70_30305 [Xenococcaceae cyanobacterium MO_207.B15]|nr:hypothetical protein [Xenococcaceae cyanobacterium MO_207.B15]